MGPGGRAEGVREAQAGERGGGAGSADLGGLFRVMKGPPSTHRGDTEETLPLLSRTPPQPPARCPAWASRQRQRGLCRSPGQRGRRGPGRRRAGGPEQGALGLHRLPHRSGEGRPRRSLCHTLTGRDSDTPGNGNVIGRASEGETRSGPALGAANQRLLPTAGRGGDAAVRCSPGRGARREDPCPAPISAPEFQPSQSAPPSPPAASLKQRLPCLSGDPRRGALSRLPPTCPRGRGRQAVLSPRSGSEERWANTRLCARMPASHSASPGGAGRPAATDAHGHRGS